MEFVKLHQGIKDAANMYHESLDAMSSSLSAVQAQVGDTTVAAGSINNQMVS